MQRAAGVGRSAKRLPKAPEEFILCVCVFGRRRSVVGGACVKIRRAIIDHQRRMPMVDAPRRLPRQLDRVGQVAASLARGPFQTSRAVSGQGGSPSFPHGPAACVNWRAAVRLVRHHPLGVRTARRSDTSACHHLCAASPPQLRGLRLAMGTDALRSPPRNATMWQAVRRPSRRRRAASDGGLPRRIPPPLTLSLSGAVEVQAFQPEIHARAWKSQGQQSELWTRRSAGAPFYGEGCLCANSDVGGQLRSSLFRSPVYE